MEIRPEEFLSFGEWLGAAMRFFVIAVPILTFLALFGCFLFSTFRRGPVEAFYAVAGAIATAIGKDLPATSPRRILAITRLTIKEAIRRRVVVAFIIFVIVFLFAGWFLDVKSDDPAQLYLSFVLTTTNYLAIVLALFLAAASLPTDIKSKVIYTIVTKPVRSGELVLGRILGFITVISVLLAAMCAISYLFVERGMYHEHETRTDSVAVIPPLTDGGEPRGWEGSTTVNSYHSHTWRVDPNGVGLTDKVMGHQHVVIQRPGNDSDQPAYELGPPEGALVARVPIYGRLRFLDRDGNPTMKGINVGKEWDYRSYIEGRSLATAIWSFDGIHPRDFPADAEGNAVLPLALTLSVFRTVKADIETGVRGVIIVNGTNPRKPMQCEPIPFVSREFELHQMTIPRKLRPVGTDGSSGSEIDLFDDLVHEGNLEVWIRCDDPMQYFGMAQADLYVEAPNASFPWNFAKGYLAIWLQMAIVVCLGVTFSTFLSTPVAMLATMSAVVIGFFGQFVRDLWTGEAVGGGPIESLIRLVTQDNMMTPLDFGLDFGSGDIAENIIKMIDNFLLTILQSLAVVLPDFSRLSRATEYVAYSFYFHNDLLARQGLTTFIYLAAFTIVGYFFLRTREIAA
jgi:hypothetical protein